MNLKRYREKRRLYFISTAILIALYFCAIASPGQELDNSNLSVAQSEADMLFMLLQIQADVQGKLNDFDADLANAAQNLSVTGLDGSDAREILRKLLETNSNLVSSIAFSKDGKIITAEGRETRAQKGLI